MPSGESSDLWFFPNIAVFGKTLEFQNTGSFCLEFQIFLIVLGEIAGIQHVQNKIDGFFGSEIADLGIQPLPAGHGQSAGGVLPQQVIAHAGDRNDRNLRLFQNRDDFQRQAAFAVAGIGNEDRTIPLCSANAPADPNRFP